jgi:4'-phosphopantetheinyl transferase
LLQNEPKIQHFTLHKNLQYALLDLEEFALCFGLKEKRAIEKRAALYVVKHILKDERADIFYEESGRPYLDNGMKISVSHSYNWLAVIVSASIEVGIDIEKVRDKILKIKEKFLSEEELNELKGASPEKYTLYWCAKEVLYKASGVSGLIFAQQLLIEPFAFSNTGGKIKAVVKLPASEKKHTLHYEVLNDYVLVYTFE